MSLGSWMTGFFTATDSSARTSSDSDAPHPSTSSSSAPSVTAETYEDGTTRQGLDVRVLGRSEATLQEDDDFEQAARPPFLHSMLAGGIGGTCGDLVMHSLDTVKTRQQGDPHIPPKYTSMSSSYATMFRQEGIRKGLYSGVTPALLGSFPGTVIFFGAYEWSKRNMLDAGINPSLAYLTGGFLADLAASFVYVPSEVLKTRLQLQGRHNNPFFHSGYNYRSTTDAFRTICRVEGFPALYSGFKATLFRDLPFSALQFAFYEQEQKMAKQWVGSREIGLGLEVLTATTAGGIAGVMTCPLDVVKTRFQTQHNPETAPQSTNTNTTTNTAGAGGQASGQQHNEKRPHPSTSGTHSHSHSHSHPQSRPVSKPSPSPSTVKPPPPSSSALPTSSISTGLGLIYRSEGILGWFRGVGPRFLWTSVQSGTMLVLYQFLLKHMAALRSAQEAENSPL